MPRRRVPEFFRKLKAFSATAGGNTQRIQFNRELPDKIGGRPLHLIGLYAVNTIQYDAVAATMEGAMSRDALPLAISNIRLAVHPHNFWDNVRLYDLWKDARLRWGRVPTPGSADIADSDATDGTVTVTSYIPLCRPNAQGPKRYDGAIPVALLNEAKGDGRNVLEYTLDQNFGGFAGVTIDTHTITWYAHLAALDELRFPAPWRVRVHETSELDAIIRTVGGIEYLALANLLNTTNTPDDFDHSALGNCDLTVDNETLFTGHSVTDLIRGANMARVSNVSGFHGVAGNSHVDVDDLFASTEMIPLIYPHPDTDRTKLAQGTVRVKWASDADYSTRRYLLRETGVHSVDVLKSWARQMGVPFESMTVEPAAARPKAGALKAQPILDMRVYWPGMPYEVPGQKVARKAARRRAA